MKTRKFLTVALFSLLLCGAQGLVAQQISQTDLIREAIESIGYPVFAADKALEGDVQVVVTTDSDGNVNSLKAWGADRSMVQYVERRLGRLDLASASPAAAGEVMGFRVAFRLNDTQLAPEHLVQTDHTALKDLLEDCLADAGLISSSIRLAVNVAVQTNADGSVADFRVWGADRQLTASVEQSMRRTLGLSFSDLEGEGVKRFMLVLK